MFPPHPQNQLAKIIPKSSQNPSQIFLNCSNIGLKSQTHSKCVSKPILNRFFVIFSNLLRVPGLPKSSQDHQNLGEKRLKIDVEKKTCFWERFCIEFLALLLLKMEPKSMFFNTFFENVDFVKIIVFPKGICYFSGLGLTKIHPKLEKRMAKNHPKNRFSGFFSLPKISPNPPKIEKKLLQKAT